MDSDKSINLLEIKKKDRFIGHFLTNSLVTFQHYYYAK